MRTAVAEPDDRIGIVDHLVDDIAIAVGVVGGDRQEHRLAVARHERVIRIVYRRYAQAFRLDGEAALWIRLVIDGIGQRVGRAQETDLSGEQRSRFAQHALADRRIA